MTFRSLPESTGLSQPWEGGFLSGPRWGKSTSESKNIQPDWYKLNVWGTSPLCLVPRSFPGVRFQGPLYPVICCLYTVLDPNYSLREYLRTGHESGNQPKFVVGSLWATLREVCICDASQSVAGPWPGNRDWDRNGGGSLSGPAGGADSLPMWLWCCPQTRQQKQQGANAHHSGWRLSSHVTDRTVVEGDKTGHSGGTHAREPRTRTNPWLLLLCQERHPLNGTRSLGR